LLSREDENLNSGKNETWAGSGFTERDVLQHSLSYSDRPPQFAPSLEIAESDGC
jgi:hypothetical protein